MKKTSFNNQNNKINNIKESKVIINMDNKNLVKSKDKKSNLIKKELNINKNQCSNNNIKNLKNKSIQQNLEYIPTIIFNLNSNNKITLNSIDTKSKIKSKSNENNHKHNKNNNKIINCKKASIYNPKIKNIIAENNNNIFKTKAQTQPQKKITNTNTKINNLNKNLINKQKLLENISINNKSISPHLNNNKKQSGTTLSLSSNKKDIIGIQLINFINKKNFTNFKTTPITLKNSEKNSKEKTQHNKNIKNNINDNKNMNSITCKLIAPKKKVSNQKKDISNKNYLKTFIKKFSNINLNKDKKLKSKNKNNVDLSNSKITTTKNSNSNLSNISNFYSINFLSKSFANKKNLKKANIYKTKIETKTKNENEFKKTSNKYFENINNQNIFPITISNYKNNYININININNKKNKKNNNNTFYLNRITKNKILHNNNKISKNANNLLKTKEITKKKKSTTNKTKLENKINYKNKIKESITKKINNIINNTNINNLKYKQISYFDIKKSQMPMTYTSSITQNKSYIKSSKIKNIESNTKNNNNNINNSSIIATKDNLYYQQESIKLINYIKKFGLEHNNISYPETDMNYYKIGRNIGHGAFGKVNIALHVLSGHIVAIKSFNKIKKSFPLNRIYYEIKLLKKLRNHKNIIKYFEHFETEKYFCIVMENISGGNLLNAINKMSKFSEPMAKNIFKQLILTIKYLHNMGIVHRDIKPDNILLELDNTIKLCDFGVSKQIKKGQLLTDSCGTPAFIAPEILKDEPYDPYITDIWSSGVVLYIIVSGFFPFRGVNEAELRKNILEGNYPQLFDISENLKDLINKMLEINPKKRINLDEILIHPWLNDNLNENNININIFTKAEKIIYGKLKFDYRQEHKENVLENFTYKNILTEYEQENMNVKTMSFIITPYNTRRPRDDDDDLFYEDVNIENDVMNFFAKVGEINREYELRNNYDFDQGFIIAKKYNNKQKIMNSKNNSFDDDYVKQNKNNKNNNDKNNNDKIIENQNVNDIKDKKANNDDLNKNKIIKINENVVKVVENFGYNRKYIIRSLQTNEINHAIASYYLMLSLLNE